MRKYPALRPRLYAEEVEKLIRRVAIKGERIDLHAESRRIFGDSGVSIDVTLQELADVGALIDIPAVQDHSAAGH